MKKYRLYIDEVGHSGLKNISEKSRYLSLTGIICDLEDINSSIHKELEELKGKYFPSHHVDDPVVFHRKELLQKKGCFYPLKDNELRSEFDKELLNFLSCSEYTAITVSIDKLEHKNRYGDWSKDPYHYCLGVLLERYKFFLDKKGGIGDVLAESRGGKEDLRLKKEFLSIFENGTGFISSEDFQKYFTSKKLKVKTKQHNIAGLQLADLIAHPSFIYSKCIRNKEKMSAAFGSEVVSILRNNKYLTFNGKLTGWGMKWLP